MEDLVGQQIGHLRVLAPLGRGGMGVVYEARHEKLGRRVAIKVLREHERFQAEARARLLQEAQLLSQLSHPNICLIHDYLTEGKRDVVVLELVTGRSLRQAIADGSIKDVDRMAIAEQLLSAMAAAHGQGIVHRDLKPDNVMLTPEGQAKILDFGLAHRPEEPDSTMVQRPVLRADSPSPGADFSQPSLLGAVGRVTGSVDYMSPEQARGEEATPASDMYSLGVVLQELFTGTRVKRKGTLGDRLEQASKGETTPVSGIDHDLAALIERMKSVNPGSRPSAHDALERLHWIAGLPRRRMRQLVSTAAVLVLALLAAGMAWQAYRARQAAERAEKAWSEAEGLTAFMLEDLIESLRPLGRLDLLDQVADEAQRYYQAVPHELQSADRRYRHSLALRTLGQVLELEGRWEHAENGYRRVLTLSQDLVAEEPGEKRFAISLQRAWDDLGDVLLEEGKVDEAEAAFREALRLAEELSSGQPQDPAVAGLLTDAWDDLGGLYEKRGDLGKAMETYQESLDAARRLTVREPANATWQSALARAYHRIGTVQQARGELTLARAAFDETLRIDREVATRNPGDTEHTMNLARALYDVSAVSAAAGDHAVALAAIDEGLRIDRRLVDQDPTNARWRSSLGSGLLALGDLHAKAGDVAEARAAWQEARAVLTPLSTTPYRALYEKAVARAGS